MTPPVDDISLETGAVTLLVICCCCCCCIGCRFDPSWVGKTTVSPTAKIAGDDSIVIRDIDWGGEGTDDDDSFDAATLIKLFIFQFKIDKVFFFLSALWYSYAMQLDGVRNGSKMDALCYRMNWNIWRWEHEQNLPFEYLFRHCQHRTQNIFKFRLFIDVNKNDDVAEKNERNFLSVFPVTLGSK